MAKPRKAQLFEVFNTTRSTVARKPWSLPRWLRRNPPVKAPEPAAPVETHRSPGLRLSVDSGEQTISLVLSFGSAAISACAIVIVVGLAFVLGRHAGRGPLPLLAERTTDELRQQPVAPGVLNVTPVPPQPANGAIPISTQPSAQTPSPRQQNWNDPRPPATLVSDDTKRTVGLNYVIIQSYPEKKDAEQARDILVQRGVFCTVEPAPAGWAQPSWGMFSVIGIRGFDKIRNSPEFDRYIAQIQKISAEFAGRSRFKQFAPQAYKWREAK